MKKLLTPLLLLLCPLIAAAQGQTANSSNPLGGDIRASSTNCSVASSCVWQRLPANATSLSVTVANGPIGSYTGTLQFEQSADGGFTFVAASPASTSTVGVFTFTVTTFTDFRVRASAFASGDASVNMQASGPATGPPGPAGPAGGGSGITPNSPVPTNQAQGPQYNIINYASGLTVNDAKKTTAAVTGNGSSTITDATWSPFLAADVGKKIFCYGLSNNNALNLTIATITVFNSASSITVNTTGNGNAQNPSTCIWYSNKAITAFQAANTAALNPTNAFKGFIETSSPGAVFCPPGGYVVDTAFFSTQGAASNTLLPSFIGAGKGACRIYISPDVTATATAYIISITSGYGQTLSGFSVDCSLANISLAAQGIRLNTVNTMHVNDIEIDGCGSSGDVLGLIWMNNARNFYGDGITINSTSSGSSQPAISITASNLIHLRNMYTTNPSVIPLQIVGSGGLTQPGGPRSNAAGGVFIENSVFDEGGNPGIISVTAGSSVALKGVSAFTGTNTVLSVDGTSSAYLDGVNFVPFGGTCSAGNRQAITLSANAYVYATGSELQGCGANGAGLSAVVSGPASATFVSAGGNTFRNCPGTPCPLVTAAQYATLGFNGGIVPKSSETHTPNTCYAVTGNLLATAQNVCTFLNDQNYQVINITAQSGGTTPANSACATPPIITLSDGTRTATLTMTTGKTQWSSAVDASTVNSVFASGTTLTISIAANTCATPPANVAVSYVLQSVLNN